LQVPNVPFPAFPFFNFPLHDGQVAAEFEFAPVPEPDVVVGLTFYEFDALGFEARVEFGEGLVEETREEKERGALVEAVAFGVEQAAATAGEGVFFEDGHGETGFRETGGGGDAAYTGAWEGKTIVSWFRCVVLRLGKWWRALDVEHVWEASLPMTMAVRGLVFSELIAASSTFQFRRLHCFERSVLVSS
jgi:hypothetical protein